MDEREGDVMGARLRLLVTAILGILLLALLAGCSDDAPPSLSEADVAQQSETETATSAVQAQQDAMEQEAVEQQAVEEEQAQAETETDTEESDDAQKAVADEEQSEREDEPELVQFDPDEPLPFDPDVTVGTLSNGLTYYIRQNAEPQGRANLSLVVRAGSVLEEEQQRGLAHFVEHMAFNGTERFEKQEIIEYLESIGSDFGAHLNAYTGFDETVYFLEVPTDDAEIMETTFQILSDWAYGITFDPEEVELERGVVLEEWRLFQGFDSRFNRNLFPLLFGSSQYATRGPIGLVEVIESAPVEELRAYYERWYRPSLMAVIAVGDFEVEQIEAKIKQHFAPSPEGEATQERAVVAEPVERPMFDVPDNEEPEVDVFTDPEAPFTQLYLVRKQSPEQGRDVAALQRGLTTRLAFSMLGARLFERGQEADPPYLGSFAGYTSFVLALDIEQFAIATTQEGLERGFTALLEEIQRTGQHGFTESELEREKINLLSEAERQYTNREQIDSSEIAGWYREHFLSGAPATGIDAQWELYQSLLPQISLADVDAVSAAWIEARNSVLLVLGPEGIDPSGGEELEATLAAQLAGASAMVVEPYADEASDDPLIATIPTAGAIVAEESLDVIDAVQWTLSNGITVVAKQTDFKDDEVRFSSFSPGGTSLVSDEDYVSALYAANLIDGSGVGEHDSVALDRLLTGTRVAVVPYIDDLYEGLRGNASPKDLEVMFQLIHLYVTAPRLDPDFYPIYEERLRSSAELRPTQPDAVLFDRVNSLLSQGHLRGRPFSLEVVEELNMERAESVYVDRFADMGDARFVIVGAFDWDELRTLTETYLASLPTTGRVEAWVDHNLDPPQGVIDETVNSGIEPRSNTVWVFEGESTWSREEALAVEIAGEMLGTRLRERIREALGGTYSISVWGRMSSIPDSEYQVGIIFGSDPDRVEELLGEIELELDWLRGGGEQSYLDTVKEQLRVAYEEDLRENSFWVNQIETVLIRGEPFELITSYEERVDALTLERVAESARRILPMDRWVRVVLYPEDE